MSTAHFVITARSFDRRGGIEALEEAVLQGELAGVIETLQCLI
jgi:hypothetical protein